MLALEIVLRLFRPGGRQQDAHGVAGYLVLWPIGELKAAESFQAVVKLERPIRRHGQDRFFVAGQVTGNELEALIEFEHLPVSLSFPKRGLNPGCTLLRNRLDTADFVVGAESLWIDVPVGLFSLGHGSHCHAVHCTGPPVLAQIAIEFQQLLSARNWLFSSQINFFDIS